jgi:hypothetical protein
LNVLLGTGSRKYPTFKKSGFFKPKNTTVVSQMLLQADGDASLLSRNNYLANLQVLIAELDASKDLNQKVGTSIKIEIIR